MWDEEFSGLPSTDGFDEGRYCEDGDGTPSTGIALRLVHQISHKLSSLSEKTLDKISHMVVNSCELGPASKENMRKSLESPGTMEAKKMTLALHLGFVPVPALKKIDKMISENPKARASHPIPR